ncbi:MAG TPA: serine/threonine-protein kinase [Gemmatimonadales bacterium]|nr:serine/threonine-protein kinase [Gemmatimonadales bacterium]
MDDLAGYVAKFKGLFEIERLVARSDQRLLFLARDPVLKRRVALRVHTDPAVPGRAWFLKEAEVVAQLDHPCLRHAYAAGILGDLAWRTGAWIEGESLEEACERGPRPIPAVLGMARDLLDGLEHANVRGIVIRRILPTTLMLEVSGRTVITDLRYANQVLPAVAIPDAKANVPFLAPEIRGGEPGDPAADVYTAGAVLYYAVTATAPRDRPVPARRLRVTCPAALERVLERAMAPDPHERYLTPGQMLADLMADSGAFAGTDAGPPPAHIEPGTEMWEQQLRRALGDDYELLGDIGSGSFGRVYRVRDLKLEREVALKVLDPALTADPEVVERFRREAQLAASLQHPNIVSIFDIDERFGLLWYTMELVKGENLGQLVEELGPLDPESTVGILNDTLAALEHAHERRLVHRDIKPENLLLGPDGRVRVTDFGLALALPRNRMWGGATSRSGTPQFAAPEQLVGGQVDARSDLFSLGLVGYFALLGKPPLEDRTPDKVARGHVVGALPDLKARRDDVPDALVRVLKKAASMDPPARYATATTFRRALERAMKGSGERPEVPVRRNLLQRITGIFE